MKEEKIENSEKKRLAINELWTENEDDD